MPISYEEDLRKQYAKLAKKANDRLRALEKLSKEAGYKEVLEYAYRVARHDVKVQRGEVDTVRFKTSIPKLTSRKALYRNINAIKSFLDMPTSTKSGIDRIYKNRAAKMNASIGADLTWREYASFFELGLFKKMNDEYGSGTTMELLALAVKNKKKIAKSIKDGSDTVINFTDSNGEESQYSRRLNDAIIEHPEEFEDFLELIDANGDSESSS